MITQIIIAISTNGKMRIFYQVKELGYN